jgi:hypothetical protein
MNWTEPESYISIISTFLFVFSEILPFLPCKSNGLIQLIKNFMTIINLV